MEFYESAILGNKDKNNLIL